MCFRLVKAGALTRAHEKQLSMISAWAELVGYMGSITLSVIKLKEISAKEEEIRLNMEKKRWVSTQVSLHLIISTTDSDFLFNYFSHTYCHKL